MSALIRYDRPATLTDWFENLFDDGFFSWPSREIAAANWPRVDIVEEENAYRLHADLPGLAKDDIRISVENGVLTISGEKKAEKKEKKTGEYAYYERSYGSFSRAFRLPEHVDSEHINAAYVNGVLELTINKTEAAKPKQIEVKVQ